MKNFIAVRNSLLFVMFCLVVSPAFALTITDSSSFNVLLNGGAYITQNSAAGSLFSDEILASGNETKSGTVLFNKIPYFDVGGTLYFQFVYDLQEQGGEGKKQVSIDDIVISVGSIGTIWDYANGINGSIILNSTTPYSPSPLSNGGDMALYVPVSLFYGFGLTGSDLLTLTVTQSQSDNGPDEWVVLGEGSGGSFFQAGDPIGQNDVPEPTTVLLLGSGLVGLWGARKKFKK